MAKLNPDLACPVGLTRRGQEARRIILEVFRSVARAAPYTGGCRAFYSPGEWTARGEPYGGGSVLVVVYDGGDLRRVSLDGEDLAMHEAVISALNRAGFFLESMTSWAAAVYEA